jgi:hypothetical protein
MVCQCGLHKFISSPGFSGNELVYSFSAAATLFGMLRTGRAGMGLFDVLMSAGSWVWWVHCVCGWEGCMCMGVLGFSFDRSGVVWWMFEWYCF